jgi:hypothetical protein
LIARLLEEEVLRRGKGRQGGEREREREEKGAALTLDSSKPGEEWKRILPPQTY